MAATQGHGNPRWTREETILALELYFRCEGRVPSKNDERVIELSDTLRKHPFHKESSENPTFRNTDGIVFKLMNLRAAHTGKGLTHVSNMDKEIWEEFGDKPDHVKGLADKIRSLIINPPSHSQDELEEEFSEGGLVTRQHQARERNRNVRKKLLKARRSKGPLECEMCGFKPATANKALEESVFEAHHIVPLAQLDKSSTTLKDMALLCANCHRFIHRAISIEKRWYSIAEAKLLLQ
ncbi:hypothetical protein MARI_32830 [Marinobacter sp. JH2]|nr:HNH endonuclease [Marinobacter sp. JH2]QBM19140.1 hypothetical protein MARI_32830 [Marinobacter sp. JH2]